jgi:hypothetical protein
MFKYFLNKKDAVTSQVSFSTIYRKVKKAISPVVAIALLLVVAVVSVVGFSDWFASFSSGMLVDIKKQNSESGSVSVDSFVGSSLYLNSKGNTSISLITINDVDCNFNGSVSGITSINVSSCISGYKGVASIVVVTGNKVIEAYKYVDGSSVSVSEALSIVGYNSIFGQWIGGAGFDGVYSISVDSLNNVYVGGYALSDITDDGLGTISGTYSGNTEGFVFKFNSSGGYEWGQWIGGASADSVKSISVDSLNNVYVGGYTFSDITDDGLGNISGTYSGSLEGFVFKFNSSGSSEWGQWIGSVSSDNVNSISVDSLNNVYVGGYAQTDITDDGLGNISGTHSGGFEAFVFKFNSSGSSEWGQWIGGASNDGVYSISVDSLNNVYVGGNAETGITDDGLGNISGTHSGGFEAFVFKFNSSGSSEWGQWIGGASNDGVNSISVDSLNNVYVGGYAQTDITDDGLENISGTYTGAAGSNEGFVFKFNSSGSSEWGQWIGGASSDGVYSISVDSLNNVYVGGYAQTDITDDGLGIISGTYSGGYEAFVFKFNSSGSSEWGQWIGGASSDRVYSILVDSLNNVYVGGYAETDITDDGLENISGTYTGSNEGFVFKFEPVYE